MFGDAIRAGAGNALKDLMSVLIVSSSFAIGIGILCTAIIALYLLLSETQNHMLIRTVMANSVISGLGVIAILWHTVQPGFLSAFSLLMTGMTMVIFVCLTIVSSLSQRFGLTEKFKLKLTTEKSE